MQCLIFGLVKVKTLTLTISASHDCNELVGHKVLGNNVLNRAKTSDIDQTFHFT